jgi:hypothetical protein
MGARILKYRHEQQQLRETGVETGKTNRFLQDNLAVPGQNAHRLLGNLSKVQVVDQAMQKMTSTEASGSPVSQQSSLAEMLPTQRG